MKKNLAIAVLVLLFTLSITVPAFADPGGNGQGPVIGKWASFWKIHNGYNAFKPNPGQGDPDTPAWAPYGPTAGLLLSNCVDWCR